MSKVISWKNGVLRLIDQTKLPHKLHYVHCKSADNVAECIKSMKVRGAPAIGVAAGFGMALTAFYSKAFSTKELFVELEKTSKKLIGTRPTASNLFWAVDRIMKYAKVNANSVKEMREGVIKEALEIEKENEMVCKMIGENGVKLIKDGCRILTHCNAGRLATGGSYGTALAPIYVAKRQGKSLFVFVDETRPRCQGAKLTAWELQQENIPYAIIADNAAGYYMQKGEIDMVIVGADRILSNGLVANKIGTYEKAVLAKENGIPFYVAAPTSTFDSKSKEIPIEERGEDEVLYMQGLSNSGKIEKVRIAPKVSKAKNPAFDITPARYITRIITERGIVKPKVREIKRLFKNKILD
ncbi:MAG: S-methyl-5-thioribose-1-phosphate isomerase [Candidatus Aenigmarchaeota archaeon]|nr:S-methyl-5-thioribose-1-phosphate isomerase [Candidatus Aenigmarchaeota archaeon]